MPGLWTAVCKDCGKPFSYSDAVHQQRLRKGLSAPERCQEHRQRHGLETRAIGSSHFGLTPLDRPNILGGRFLGSFDRTDRATPSMSVISPDPSGLDLGLRDEHIEEIYKAVEANRVLVIVAPTGSGKSTLVPYRLLSPLPSSGLSPDHFTPHGRPIVVTQPRRIATSDIPGVIAEKMHGSKVGPGCEIGYRHGQDRDQTDPWNRLVFVTDGTLLNWLTEHRAADFSIVIVDEAHERSTTIDLILGLMRSELVRFPHLRLIILSATIHADRFAQYYEDVLPGRVWVRDFKESQKSFGYKVHWWNQGPLQAAQMIDALASKVVELLRSTTDGGILGFLPGEFEINKAVSLISERLDRAIFERTIILPLYSTLEKSERDKATAIVAPVKVGQRRFTPRRVVIATNIAETSLTIPDVSHVVDTGLIKESVWDPVTRTEGLETRWHSQAGCRQRWGRAGRTRPGTVHTLYTEEQFSSFEPHTAPAVVRECLDDAFIKAKRAGVTDFNSFPWLDSPSKAEQTRVQTVSRQRHLIDEEGDLTDVGSEVFDLYQRIGRHVGDSAGAASRTLDMATLLLLADKFACLVEASSFLVLLQYLGDNRYRRSEGLFLFDAAWPVDKRDNLTRVQSSLCSGCSDDLDLALKIFALHEGIEIDGRRFGGAGWAEQRGLNAAALDDAVLARDAILGAFIRDAKDRGTRAIDFALTGRLRYLVAAAWPDRRIVTGDGKSWRAISSGESGPISIHSLARGWKGAALGYIAGYGRGVSAQGSDLALSSGSVLIRCPRDVPEEMTVGALPAHVNRHRIASQTPDVIHRVLASEMATVDSPITVDENGLLRSLVPSIPSYRVEGPSVDGPRILVVWKNSVDGVPVAVSEPKPALLDASQLRPGEVVSVKALRAVPFPPTGGTSDLICVAKEGRIVRVQAGDLSLSSPQNVQLDEMLNKDIGLTFVGVTREGGPILTLLPELVESLQRLRMAGICKGIVLSLERLSGDSGIRLLMGDPEKPSLSHVQIVALPRERKHLESVKAGDLLYFRLAEPSQRDEWTWRLAEGELEDSCQNELSALDKFGIRHDSGVLKVRKPLSVANMYSAIAGAPSLQSAVRGIFRVSQDFRIDPDTLDTQESRQQMQRLYVAAVVIWKSAWTSEASQVRESVKQMQKQLKDSSFSVYGARSVRAALDGAWEISDLRYVTEQKARRASEWLIKQSAEVTKLREWLANARTEDKRVRYFGFLVDAQARLVKAAADHSAVEKEVSEARKRLAVIRVEGKTLDAKLVDAKEAQEASLPRDKLAGRSEMKKRTQAPGRVALASSQSAKSDTLHRDVRVGPDGLRKLTARPQGFLRMLFGRPPAESLAQQIAERWGVTIEVADQAGFRVSGKELSAIESATEELRSRGR